MCLLFLVILVKYFWLQLHGHIFFLFCALKWLHKSFFISDNYKLQNLAYYFSKCKFMYFGFFFSFFFLVKLIYYSVMKIVEL